MCEKNPVALAERFGLGGPKYFFRADIRWLEKMTLTRDRIYGAFEMVLSDRVQN
jgi:hypothetical protein